jgi:hypothetical protein
MWWLVNYMTTKEENKRDLELLKEIKMQEELQRKEMRKKQWETWKENRIYDVKVFSVGLLVGVTLTTATVLYFRAPAEAKSVSMKSLVKNLLLEILLENE